MEDRVNVSDVLEFVKAKQHDGDVEKKITEIEKMLPASGKNLLSGS